MKAWEDLKSNPEQAFFTTRTSEYWLERGVKIERFGSGVVEIRNVLRAGDFYVKINQEQLHYFVFYGWDQGVCKVNVDEFERKLVKAQERIDRLNIKDLKGEMAQAIDNYKNLEALLKERREKLKESLQKR